MNVGRLQKIFEDRMNDKKFRTCFVRRPLRSCKLSLGDIELIIDKVLKHIGKSKRDVAFGYQRSNEQHEIFLHKEGDLEEYSTENKVPLFDNFYLIIVSPKLLVSLSCGIIDELYSSDKRPVLTVVSEDTSTRDLVEKEIMDFIDKRKTRSFIFHEHTMLASAGFYGCLMLAVVTLILGWQQYSDAMTWASWNPPDLSREASSLAASYLLTHVGEILIAFSIMFLVFLVQARLNPYIVIEIEGRYKTLHKLYSILSGIVTIAAFASLVLPYLLGLG